MATQVEYVDGAQLGNGEWEANTSRVRPSTDANRTLKTDVEKADGEELKDEREVPFRFASFKRIQAFAALLGLIAISLLPLFSIAGSLAYTVEQIGGLNISNWLALVHSLGLAAVAPFAGSLSDVIGRRYMGIAGAVIVTVGMVVVGTAHKMPIAILGMGIAGAGSGITGVTGFAGIVELVPVHSRGRYMGTIFMVFTPLAASTAYGQMYSVTQTWRWSAWIPVIIAGLVIVLVAVQYHPPPRPVALDYTKGQVAGRIDYLGGFLSIAGIALLLVGLQSGGYNEPWDSTTVIATLTIGGALLLAFVAWQIFARHPMIPSYVFAEKASPCDVTKLTLQRLTQLLLFVILGAGGVMFYVLAAFWQNEIEQLYGPDPYHVAAVIAAFGFFYLIGVCVVCWGIDLLRGRLRELFIISSCMMTAGIVALSAMDNLTRTGVICLSCLGMFGVGALFVPPIIALTNLVPDDTIGTIVGLAMSIRLIFGQVGYTIFFNLLQPRLLANIFAIVPPAVIKAGLPPAEAKEFTGALVEKNFAAIAQLPGVTSAVLLAAGEGVDISFIMSFKIVYMASLAAGIVAIVASAFLPSIRKHMVDRVAVDIH